MIKVGDMVQLIPASWPRTRPSDPDAIGKVIRVTGHIPYTIEVKWWRRFVVAYAPNELRVVQAP